MIRPGPGLRRDRVLSTAARLQPAVDRRAPRDPHPDPQPTQRPGPCCTNTDSVSLPVEYDAKNVGIVVPEEVVLSFDRGKRVPVVVTIDDGYTYKTTIGVMGGRSLVSFNADPQEHRSRRG